MSTGSSSDGGRRYKPLPPPKKQIAFTSTRRTTRPVSSIVPTLNKKQSSLTQMQWVSTPPREVIDISSGDDDDDYQEPPAKRRKQSATSSGKTSKKTKLEEREAGQSSFTQVDYFGKMRNPRRSVLDEDGFQIWQDSDTEEDLEDDKQDALVTGSFAPPATLRSEESENRIPEIAESSQNFPSDDQQSQSLEHNFEKTAPALKTPQKVRFVEVPSSQTPSSTGLSTQRSGRRLRSISRSPLKERSSNCRSPMKQVRSPESQNMSMKMLERTRNANRQGSRKLAHTEHQPDEDLEQCAAEATDDFSLRTCPMPPPPTRRLRRTNTVQDSQAEDVDALTEPTASDRLPRLVRTGTIADSQRNSSNETLVEDSQSQRPARRLRQVATVEDSQFDDLDTEFDDHTVLQEHHDPHDTMNDEEEDYAQHDHYPEGTYDPAFSALDRDAGRFNWTQTQQRLPMVAEDSETEDEDIDRGFVTNAALETSLASDSAPQELGAPLASLSRPTLHNDDTPRSNPHKEAAQDAGAVEAAQRDDSAYESGDQVSTTQGAEVPSSPPPLRQSLKRLEGKNDSTENVPVASSPPPLRASQISTVVPTQASVAPRALSPRKPIKAELSSLPPTPRHQHKNQVFGFLSSPHKSGSVWQPESLSSSPLPLPPWSSPGNPRAFDLHLGNDDSIGFGNFGTDPQMDSLADFSLPPPPPMSSSRRQTPASSSL